MKSILGAAAIFLMAGSAYAADAIVYDEPLPAESGFSWTGGYVGLQAGYGWGDSTIRFETIDYVVDPDGFLGGVYVGYNYQMPSNLVLGLDADLTYTDLDGDGAEDTGSSLEWSGAIRARLGYAIDRLMPYVAGGLAFGRYEHTVANTSLSETMTGWTIGAGADYAFTDRLIGRVEYRYTDFGDGDFGLPLRPHNVDLDTNDIRFGIAYKF
jgi:outer membrane immunogenic protein